MDAKVITKCHLGYIKGLIKDVADTADLQNILKSFKTSAGIVKTAKVIVKKTDKKSAKVITPVAEVPAPVVQETELALAQAA